MLCLLEVEEPTSPSTVPIAFHGTGHRVSDHESLRERQHRPVAKRQQTHICFCGQSGVCISIVHRDAVGGLLGRDQRALDVVSADHPTAIKDPHLHVRFIVVG